MRSSRTAVNPYAKLGGRPKGAINKTARELAVMARQCYEVCVRFITSWMDLWLRTPINLYHIHRP